MVVLVGSDIPDLPPAALVAARDALAGTPRGTAVALGPADDGGFYLVAATDGASLASACAGVRWSQPTVLDEVTARLTASGRHVVRVTPWTDVDDRGRTWQPWCVARGLGRRGHAEPLTPSESTIRP